MKNQLTTVASLPGSGSGCQSALPAEVGKVAEFKPFSTVTPVTPEEAAGIAASLADYAEHEGEPATLVLQAEPEWKLVGTYHSNGTVFEVSAREAHCEPLQCKAEPVGMYWRSLNEPMGPCNHQYTEYGRALARRLDLALPGLEPNPLDVAGGGE